MIPLYQMLLRWSLNKTTGFVIYEYFNPTSKPCPWRPIDWTMAGAFCGAVKMRQREQEEEETYLLAVVAQKIHVKEIPYRIVHLLYLPDWGIAFLLDVRFEVAKCCTFTCFLILAGKVVETNQSLGLRGIACTTPPQGKQRPGSTGNQSFQWGVAHGITWLASRIKMQIPNIAKSKTNIYAIKQTSEHMPKKANM